MGRSPKGCAAKGSVGKLIQLSAMAEMNVPVRLVVFTKMIPFEASQRNIQRDEETLRVL